MSQSTFIVIPPNPTFEEMVEIYTRTTGQVVKGDALAQAREAYEQIYAPKITKAGVAWRGIDPAMVKTLKVGDVFTQRQGSVVAATRREAIPASAQAMEIAVCCTHAKNATSVTLPEGTRFTVLSLDPLKVRADA